MVTEKILIPLDGSKIGEAALPYVEQLIDRLSPRVKVEITLLQVVSLSTHYVVAVDTTVPVSSTEEEIEQIKKVAADYLDNIGKGLKSKNITVEVKVETGNAAEEIIRVADEIGVVMIAMSTHGRSGISRWAFGSVTDKVLRGGNKPVLVVRAPKDST
jgi:nucleotide-binding universal stress UspA family protein